MCRVWATTIFYSEWRTKDSHTEWKLDGNKTVGRFLICYSWLNIQFGWHSIYLHKYVCILVLLVFLCFGFFKNLLHEWISFTHWVHYLKPPSMISSPCLLFICKPYAIHNICVYSWSAFMIIFTFPDPKFFSYHHQSQKLKKLYHYVFLNSTKILSR
jgi:hypothetical protein